MNDKTEDTRATDYVLGELQGDKRAEFERLLLRSESFRDEVVAIREALAAVKVELTGESACVNEADLNRVHSAIRQADESLSATTLIGGERPNSRKWWIALASAACLLIIGSLVIPSLLPSRQWAREATREVAQFDQAEMEFEQFIEDAEGSSEGGSGGGSSASSSRVRKSKRVEPVDAGQSVAKSNTSTAQELGRNLASAQPMLKGRHEEARTTSVGNSHVGSRGFTGGSMETDGEELRGDFAIGDREVRSESEGFAMSSPEVQSEATRRPSRRDLIREQMMDEENYKEFDNAAIAFPNDMPAEPASEPDMIANPFGGANYGEESDEEESDEMFGSADMIVFNDTDLRRGQNDVRFEKADSVSETLVPLIVERQKLAAQFGEQHPTVQHLDQLIGNMRGELNRLMQQRVDGSRARDAAGDKFALINDNPFRKVDDSPLSTFSIDVDTASYAKIRMYLMQQNSLPRSDAVRIEELVNYFNYDYAPPTGDHPFNAAMEIATCPWNPKHRLARIGIKGKVIEEDRPSSNLVFLLDVSGSMNDTRKLPLVVSGMKMLADQLTENDSVAIVVYAGAAGMVLDSTMGDKRHVIHDALDRLTAGGSTNGGQGIQLAYQIARDNFIVGGTNRVILCSDGDFNVGVTGTDQLVRIAQQNAKSNIFLSVLGFGVGNHNDAMMEQVSNRGNGNYAFIDTEDEARKVLVDQIGGTLVTIAKDVKIQVEFNPAKVAAYRLIGYENRILAAEDFNDDKKDAGEIGAGHTVTALYELVPAREAGQTDTPSVDELRYQKRTKLSGDSKSGELLTLKMRYKPPTESVSKLISFSVKDDQKQFAEADQDFQFAASVAGFGMLLRGSPYKGSATFASVQEIAESSRGKDTTGYRAEFLKMVAKARMLRGE